MLRERYWDGVASRRPTRYWVWGNLAALLLQRRARRRARASPSWRIEPCSAGSGAALGAARVPVLLSGAAVATVVAADLSGMSKAEVERIWLPFVPWLLVACALLPRRWQRPALALQVCFALLVQHLLFTGW